MLKNTAANRVITDDFEVPAIIGDLDLIVSQLSLLGEKKLAAQGDYDHANRRLVEWTGIVEQGAIDKAYEIDPKTSQAAVDRAVKKFKFEDSELASRSKALYLAKADLDEATMLYDACRYAHRTAVAKASVVAASLNFLGNTKTARSAALALLNEL